MAMVTAADTDANADIADMDANSDTGAGRACAQQGNCKNGSK
jgi:hypothetical protein